MNFVKQLVAQYMTSDGQNWLQHSPTKNEMWSESFKYIQMLLTNVLSRSKEIAR
jgi:hypothetical protein